MMASPFGCVVSGCPVITSFQQVDPMKWAAPLGNAPESIVVFLTGVQPLPDGYGLGVYVAADAVNSSAAPDPAAAASYGSFEYIGYLTNECPSSIFKVPATFLSIHGATPITLGVAVETLGTIANMGATSSQPQEQRRAANYQSIALRIAEDLYNFIGSYAKTLSADPSDPQSEEMVYLPMRWANTWKERIDKKIVKDAAFWN